MSIRFLVRLCLLIPESTAPVIPKVAPAANPIAIGISSSKTNDDIRPIYGKAKPAPKPTKPNKYCFFL